MPIEVTQKLEHWRRLRGTIEQHVALNTATLPTEGRRQWAFAFTVACGQMLEGALVSDASHGIELRKEMLGITAEDMLHVYAAFYLAFTAAQCESYEPHEWEELMGFAEPLFRQPKTTIRRWVEFQLENGDSHAIATRTAYRLNEEIAPVFGLRKLDPAFSTGWLLLVNSVGSLAISLLELPEWPEIYRAAIAADESQTKEPPRVQPSGCGLMPLAGAAVVSACRLLAMIA